MTIRYDEESWRKGRAAGMAGGPAVPPPEIPDRLAYLSGYIEGKALREERGAVRVVDSDAPQ
jgi:hypothetical protein